MTDLTYQELKQHILSSINISSDNLSELSQAFSKLYISFQSDIVKKVTVEPVKDTFFKWVRSSQCDTHKVIIFLHGGGFTMGNTYDHLELIAQLVTQTGVAILSVDYRLLPSYQFPTPLEDAKSAYQWLLEHGYKTHNIGFAGISAGGLLTTQLILSSQQSKLPLPKLAVVMSGPANLRFDAPSIQYNANRDWISAERLRNISKFYLPDNGNKNDILLSPLDANYPDYPATLFQAGDYEMLVDDSMAFYRRLREINLNVYLDIVNELPHCWQLFSKVYAPGREAVCRAADFICRQFFDL